MSNVLQIALVSLRVLPVDSNILVFFEAFFRQAVYKAFIGGIKRTVFYQLYNTYI